VPAALNNVVGLKPSLGSVSSRGMLPACRTLDTISVFAGTVADADAVFRVMAGPDRADPYSRTLPVATAPAALPPGLRVGLPNGPSLRFGGDALSEAAFTASVADLAALTGQTAAIDFAPLFAVAALLYDGPWVAERYAAIRPIMENRPEILHPTTKAVIAVASRFSAADAFAGLYRLAELRRDADAVWNRVDVLAVPTYPRPQTRAALEADPIGPNSELGTYTNFVNLLDWCALAVPGRRRSDGFPSGITLLGPRGSDGLLAALGARLHAASDASLGASTMPVPAAGTGPMRAGLGEIELAVVGAHLSGLPLNCELTERGGRFLRAVATRPDYRFYALPGGPPQRPGLLRTEEGAGGPIDTEVWALPPSAFGEFVAGIPAPLGIGTLKLADGTTPKGFLVEAAGIEGATDITESGGWRGYLAKRSAA
jgi:allophanate hydrolase